MRAWIIKRYPTFFLLNKHHLDGYYQKVHFNLILQDSSLSAARSLQFQAFFYFPGIIFYNNTILKKDIQHLR
jgi:hypothetical protein